ncbi:MAG: HEAT repeat domain-containing protein [Candidatus Omnitrophota bacterium]
MKKVKSCRIVFVVPANTRTPERSGKLRIRYLRLQRQIPDITRLRLPSAPRAANAGWWRSFPGLVTERLPERVIFPKGVHGRRMIRPGVFNVSNKAIRNMRGILPGRSRGRGHAFRAISGLKWALLAGGIFMISMLLMAVLGDYKIVTVLASIVGVYSGLTATRFGLVTKDVYSAFRKSGLARKEALTKTIATSSGPVDREPEFENLAPVTQNFINLHESFKSHLKGMVAMLPGATYIMRSTPEYVQGFDITFEPEKQAYDNVWVLLGSNDRNARIAAAITLGNMGPIAKGTIYALIYTLNDPDEVVSRAAMEGLRRIGYVEEGVSEKLTVLIKALGDESYKTRRAAAEVLGEMGSAAYGAIPALMALQSDRYPSVRQVAMSAVARIDETVNLAWTDEALKQAQRRAPPTVTVTDIPALIGRLKDKKTRDEARLGLINAGRTATPALLKAIKSEDINVRREALNVFAFIGITSEEEVSAVIKAFEDEDQGVRQSAAAALSNISPEAREALPLLIEALAIDENGLSQAAMTALARIGYISRGDKDIIPMLIRALTDRENIKLRGVAVKALRKKGADAKGAVPALVNMLADRTVRRDIIMALREIGPDPRLVTPALATILGDKEKRLKVSLARTEALKLLGEMGPAAAAAVPAIEAIANDTSDAEGIRKLAQKTLKKVKPGRDSEQDTPASGKMPPSAGLALFGPVAAVAGLASIAGLAISPGVTLTILAAGLGVIVLGTAVALGVKALIDYLRRRPAAIVIGIKGISGKDEVIGEINERIGGVKIVALESASEEENMRTLRTAKRQFGAYAQGIINIKETGIKKDELPSIVNRLVDEIQAKDKRLLTLSNPKKRLKKADREALKDIRGIFREIGRALPVIKYLEVSEVSAYNMRFTNNVKINTAQTLTAVTNDYIRDEKEGKLISARANSLGGVKLLVEAHRKRMEEAGYADPRKAPVKLQIRLAVSKSEADEINKAKRTLLEKMEIEDVLSENDLIVMDENVADSQTVSDIYKGIKGYKPENIAIVEPAKKGRSEKELPEDKIVFMEYEGIATSVVYDATLTLLARDERAKILFGLEQGGTKRVWPILPLVKGVDTKELRKEIERYHKILIGA